MDKTNEYLTKTKVRIIEKKDMSSFKLLSYDKFFEIIKEHVFNN